VDARVLSEPERASLVREAAALARAKPELRARVRDVQGVRPEVYGRARNPKPEAQRELRALGPDARSAILEALFLDASQRELAPSDREALAVGMVATLGHFADSRNQPYLRALAERASAKVASAAVEAVGHACNEGDVAWLSGRLVVATAAKSTDPELARAAIAGLGACRREASAKALSALLADTAPSIDRDAIHSAMGKLGSSWGWAALEAAAKRAGKADEAARIAERGGRLRASLAAALVDRLALTATHSEAATRALATIDAPGTADLVDRRASEERTRGHIDRADALEALARRLRPVRGR
jgi:hypothetical protein